MNYEHSMCIKCHLPRCAYEEDGMTVAQQKNLCPIPNTPSDGRRNSHLAMSPWKRMILTEIRDTIKERGAPVPLAEFSTRLDIVRSTLYDWRSTYLKTTKIRMSYAHWKNRKIVCITGVIFDETYDR